MSLLLHPTSLLLILSGNNDTITLKADDSGEMLTLMYEDPKADRVSGEVAHKQRRHFPSGCNSQQAIAWQRHAFLKLLAATH